MAFPFFSTIDQEHLVQSSVHSEKQPLLDALLDNIQKNWEGGPFKHSFSQTFSPVQKWTSFSDNTLSRSLGEELLQKEKVAILVFAGGLGTRLGSLEPKGCFPIKNGKTLFQLLFEKITHFERAHAVSIPLILGLSSFTYEKTRLFLQKHHFFGKNPSSITYLLQKDYPYFDEQGKILFSQNELIPMAPTGNGGFYDLLKQEKIIETLLHQGIEFLHSLFIDNPLDDPLDPYLLGEMVLKKSQAGLLAIPRENPQEKTGILVSVNGITCVIDYMEIPPVLHAELAKYTLANMGHYCFRLDFIQKLMKNGISLPFHFVKKSLVFEGKEIPVLKGEKFAMDLFQYSEQTSVLLYPKKGHFAPLKQLEGNGGLEEVQQALL